VIKVSNVAWRTGPKPLNLLPNQVDEIIALFLRETGEGYSEASVRHLPIPSWNGNLLLMDDTSGHGAPVQGVFWATPFKEDIVRVAAFVLDAEVQRMGWGGKAWDIFVDAAWNLGYRRVQLEVKAENTDAQRFYEARGLIIQQELRGYYQSGLGYMMLGPLRPPV